MKPETASQGLTALARDLQAFFGNNDNGLDSGSPAGKLVMAAVAPRP
jgi:hypothetical protein